VRRWEMLWLDWVLEIFPWIRYWSFWRVSGEFLESYVLSQEKCSTQTIIPSPSGVCHGHHQWNTECELLGVGACTWDSYWRRIRLH
jgi:hypothetical protein